MRHLPEQRGGYLQVAEGGRLLPQLAHALRERLPAARARRQQHARATATRVGAARRTDAQ
jgi:hypothetical protein